MRSARVAISAWVSCIAVPAYGLPPIGFERCTEPDHTLRNAPISAWCKLTLRSGA
jgi:hypothetical protein